MCQRCNQGDAGKGGSTTGADAPGPGERVAPSRWRPVQAVTGGKETRGRWSGSAPGPWRRDGKPRPAVERAGAWAVAGEWRAGAGGGAGRRPGGGGDGNGSGGGDGGIQLRAAQVERDRCR